MDEDELADSGVSIHTGFPNAGVGSHARQLDLVRLLIKHPASTFLMKLDSNEWQDRGIFAGDIIVVDRALDPRRNDLVIWWEGESFYISHFESVAVDAVIWGVVTTTIHQFRV